MQSAPPPQTPTPLLWERLRALFERVIATIGAPALIAALTFAPRMRTGIVRQLALIEILARKLLLAEAAELAPPAQQRGPRLIEIQLSASGLYTAPPTRRGTRATSTKRAVDLSKPETWSARFALAVPRDRTISDRNAPRIRDLWGDARKPPPPPEPKAPQRNSDAFLIARRAEALRRVLHNPAPYVTRLSRTRRIGVARSRQTIMRYALKAPRRFIGDRDDPLLTVHIFSAAVRAHAILTDTS
ncbi:MAG: hypothetical protein NT015_07510 [Alphaproteobacteria bacterium]|nr:hypothetical protein [Alphaproteobacteria bacterium]